MADIEVMHSYRIGLIGLGTVGLSFAELLTRFGDECSQSCGRSLELRRVVVRDRDRALARWQAALPTVPPPKWTGEVDRVVGADDIDLVVELVGGVDLPREWIRRALKSGQDVVTANKAVLAAHGEELFEIADKFGRSLLFEGAAAGAIPILQVIREGLTAGPITSLQAILNGSTNWLIGALGQGRSMAEALDEARERGLVEADPTLDIAGTDAAHKLALIARLLTGRRVDFAAIRCEGIADLGPEDLAFGCRQGLELRLVAHMSTREPGRAELGVFPEWHAKDHPLASIHDENNAVILEGPTFGSLMFVGRGAGGKPTAGSVMADTVRAARGAGRISSTKQRLEVLDPLDRPRRHYVRLRVPDEPGVLARVASALAEERVSVASLEQIERRNEGQATIHVITHTTTALSIDRSLGGLTEETLVAPPLRIAISAGVHWESGDDCRAFPTERIEE